MNLLSLRIESQAPPSGARCFELGFQPRTCPSPSSPIRCSDPDSTERKWFKCSFGSCAHCDGRRRRVIQRSGPHTRKAHLRSASVWLLPEQQPAWLCSGFPSKLWPIPARGVRDRDVPRFVFLVADVALAAVPREQRRWMRLCARDPEPQDHSTHERQSVALRSLCGPLARPDWPLCDRLCARLSGSFLCACLIHACWLVSWPGSDRVPRHAAAMHRHRTQGESKGQRIPMAIDPSRLGRGKRQRATIPHAGGLAIDVWQQEPRRRILVHLTQIEPAAIVQAHRR